MKFTPQYLLLPLLLMNHFPLCTEQAINNVSTQPSYAYLFAHGLGGNIHQQEYYNQYGIIYDALPSFAYNAPEVLGGNAAVNLGQEGDIKTLCQINADAHDKYIIGVGVSKGAAGLINAAHRIKNLKALILESPFASANNVFHNHPAARYTGIRFLGSSVTAWAGNKMFPGYNRHGIQPIDTIHTIPADITVIFLHSKQDSLISVNESRKLYIKRVKALKKAGLPNNTYLIETDEGMHANVIWANNKNAHSVPRIINTIMHHAGLPHNPALVTDIDITTYQPTVKTVKKLIKK